MKKILLSGTDSDERLYLTDCIFECTQKILSVPEYHGARWIALLRYACNIVNIDCDSTIFGILPFRNGSSPINKGELIRLRIIVYKKNINNLPVLLNALSRVAPQGEFSSRTLKLLAVIDPFSHSQIDPAHIELCCSTLDENLLEAEFNHIKLLKGCTLKFSVPLRVAVPPNIGHTIEHDSDRYADSRFFEECGDSPLRILEFIRGIKRHIPEGGVFTDKVNLKWETLAYNKDREIKLGGVTGTMSVYFENLSDEGFFRLVLGQYLGAGKSPRFGLGFYRIQELDDIRTPALL